VASLNRRDVLDGHATGALIVGKGRRERRSSFDAEARKAMRAYLEARTDTLAPLFLRHDNRRGRPGQDGETLAAVAAIHPGHRQALRG
jgi:site-specific recombinase XerC